jgi:hypothetical protein
MEIDVNQIFSDRDKDELREVLGLKAEDEINQTINALALSALAEYRQMLLEGGMPPRGQDALESRLFYLIKHYFWGRSQQSQSCLECYM